jgi:serine/threonine protein kinase
LVAGFARGAEVDRRELVYIAKLGSGQYGDVSLMATRLFAKGGQQQSFVAVKTLKRADSSTTNLPSVSEDGAIAREAEAVHKTQGMEFLDEIDVMKQLPLHPNLVALLGVCTATRPYMMVLEYLPGGSLDTWLPENGAAAHPDGLVSVLQQVVGRRSLTHAHAAISTC